VELARASSKRRPRALELAQAAWPVPSVGAGLVGIGRCPPTVRTRIGATRFPRQNRVAPMSWARGIVSGRRATWQKYQVWDPRRP